MIVLCAGGLDPSGGAGILADARAVADLGGRPMAVATAWTAQSSRGVAAWGALPADAVRAQVAALLHDFPVAIVKVGMVGSAEVAGALADLCVGRDVVLDPVLVASVGGPLAGGDVAAALRAWLPRVRLVTPNLDEAEALAGTRDAEAAARALVAMGARAALVKGGETAVDVLCDRDSGRVERIAAAPVATDGPVHGTGCMLASAIATLLARQTPLPEAVRLAKEYVAVRIAAAAPLGTGPLRYA
ncbi:MAG: hydroxymethylpyrimidine/phosphomethylpyrimidine kinase [Myxococcota bacterium]